MVITFNSKKGRTHVHIESGSVRTMEIILDVIRAHDPKARFYSDEEFADEHAIDIKEESISNAVTRMNL